MSSDVEAFVLEQIENAAIQRLPSPHFFIEGILPDNVYEDLLANMPSNDDFVALSETGRVRGKSFDRRFVFFPTKTSIETLPPSKQAFWRDMQWLYGKPFMLALCRKFAGALRARLAEEPEGAMLKPEVLIVRDREGYEIGPHTDAVHRFMSLLLYCPTDNDREHLGTSLYVPRERGFTCKGGPHHSFDKFVRVTTLPYRRNSMFGFLKTSTSFHGVETIPDKGVERDIMLYNMRIGTMRQGAPLTP